MNRFNEKRNNAEFTNKLGAWAQNADVVKKYETVRGVYFEITRHIVLNISICHMTDVK